MSEPSILLTTNAECLRFQDPHKQNQFELGVASAVFLWDDLATAVANGWGGPESAEKREWLAGSIVDLFDESEVATEDVEFRLLAAMEDEFDVTIETGTALAVAQQIIKLYQDCADENFTLAQELFSKFQARTPAERVVVQEVHEDLDEEDEEQEDEAEPQLMEVEAPVPQGPVPDEDGFMIVQKKGRR